MLTQRCPGQSLSFIINGELNSALSRKAVLWIVKGTRIWKIPYHIKIYLNSTIQTYIFLYFYNTLFYFYLTTPPPDLDQDPHEEK